MRRRHFTRSVRQHTDGSFLVLQLVEGLKASSESLQEAFAPMGSPHGQRLIVPAAVGEFMLRPAGLSAGRSWVMRNVFVRMRHQPATMPVPQFHAAYSQEFSDIILSLHAGRAM